MTENVNVQVLVARQAREPKQMDELAARLATLGIHVTARGAATLSAEVSPSAMKKVFGVTLSTSGGFVSMESSDVSLPVPAELSGAVDLISPVSRHQILGPGEQDHSRQTRKDEP